MQRYKLVDGEMVEAEDGEYLKNDEAVNYMQTKVQTLLVQIRALVAYLEALVEE